MTDAEQADIKARTAALKLQAELLQAELLLFGACQDAGTEADVEGARQAVCSAVTKIEDNLTVLKGYCS